MIGSTRYDIATENDNNIYYTVIIRHIIIIHVTIIIYDHHCWNYYSYHFDVAFGFFINIYSVDFIAGITKKFAASGSPLREGEKQLTLASPVPPSSYPFPLSSRVPIPPSFL